jgi:AraC-like DNA-binding protein
LSINAKKTKYFVFFLVFPALNRIFARVKTKRLIMTLEDNSKNIHPYFQYKKTATGDEVTVLDNITAAPVYREEFTTDDMLIVVCHRGRTWGERGTLEKQDVYVLLPHEIISIKFSSEDFMHSLVIISYDFYEKLKHSYLYTRYTSYHRNRAETHLNDEQYEFVNNALGMLRVMTKVRSRHRSEMLFQQMSIMLNMLGEFSKENYPEEMLMERHMTLFSRFYEKLTEHYRESHEVAFYAKLFGLTPKYFSAIIKKETGASAIKWISEYVTVQAKQLLDVRTDYTVLQVSRELGFSDQASFSRYFRKYTGMTPREYRDGKRFSNKN